MQMSHANKPSGMKLVFMQRVREITLNEEHATPARIAREYNMTYRQILNIAFDLAERGLIKRIIENWTVRYELTKDGERILYN